MRAWYGKGRYWFVVAASAGATTAWGWYGYEQRWEPIGGEYIDWFESDFAEAIDMRMVPADLLMTLAQTLDDMANTLLSQPHGIGPHRPQPAFVPRALH